MIMNFNVNQKVHDAFLEACLYEQLEPGLALHFLIEKYVQEYLHNRGKNIIND